MLARRRVGSSVLLALVPLAAGCDGSSPGEATTLTDSAGVPVVVNARPGEETPRFGLSEAPLLVIGDADRGPQHELFRVSGAARLETGRIVVANASTSELRYFDDSGTYVGSGGGEGQGPGEMMSLTLVGTFATDSVVVWDVRQRRFSVFGPDGTFGRSFQAPDDFGPSANPVGVLGDGRPVVLLHELAVSDPEAVTGIERRPSRLLVVGRNGGVESEVGSFPGPETSVVIRDPGPAVFGVIFGRSVHAAARDERIAVGTDDAYSLRSYAPDGSLTRIVRQTRPPIQVAPGDFERSLPEVLRPDAPSTPAKERFVANIEQMPRHETFPAFGAGGARAVRIDRSGHLWVEEHRTPWTGGAAWQVFAPDGALLGRLDVTEDTDWMDAGSGWILLRIRDELGVERVVLYELLPASAEASPGAAQTR